MSRIYFGGLLIFLLAVSSIAHSETLKGSAKHCSVPPDFAVSDGEGLSPEQKRFLGYFSGYWDDQLYHTLLVADITKDGTASAYYAWEAYAGWNIDRPGCTRFKAKIDDGKLTGTLRSSAKVKYWFSDPDTLTGEYDRRNRVTPGIFKRQK